MIRQSMSDPAYKLDATGQVVSILKEDGQPYLVRDVKSYAFIVNNLAATRGREVFPVSHSLKSQA